MSSRRVSISEQGRSGDVVYEEDGHTISGWWEFAGGDAVAIVCMGSADQWQRSHPWAVERRAEILRFLADEPNRVNLRFDVGVAEDEVNFYLNFLEAF